MTAADRLAAARAAQDAAAREQQEQRALRDRRVTSATADAKESLHRDAEAHSRYLARVEDLRRRHQASGGWLTEKSMTDRPETLDLTPPADAPPTGEPTPPLPGHPAGATRFDDHDFSNNTWLVD
ncbi:hypothetical protein VSH64_41210 [Amycolatopsis rhabdoformis]|uniref:Uncharacterized protein n=1 Tax=Amycolatopsis rhabdoformis TaxID=1448059 RepID=A0ABZ1I4P9_9PSEU|nr:hypothetical protein [Amycolatopsis rhabdoformis]WSE29169.1 hypothetical protein VSH64_41210 [Amycolatopsis rhabdoformis]